MGVPPAHGPSPDQNKVKDILRTHLGRLEQPNYWREKGSHSWAPHSLSLFSCDFIFQVGEGWNWKQSLWPPDPGPLKVTPFPEFTPQAHGSQLLTPPLLVHLPNQLGLVLGEEETCPQTQIRADIKRASRWKENELFSVEIVSQHKVYSPGHKAPLRWVHSWCLRFSPCTDLSDSMNLQVHY